MHSNLSASKIAGLNDNAIEEITETLRQIVVSHKRILDIGCGEFPYLAPLLSKANITLWDKQRPQKSIEGVIFEEFSFLPGEAPVVEKPFDLIILSTVLHELYLQWNLNRLCGTRRDSKEDLSSFFTCLFDSLKPLLEHGGSILIAENYHPKIIRSEALLTAREVQEAKYGHADSPAAFIDPSIIINNAIKHNLELETMKDVRCVSDQNVIFNNGIADSVESQLVFRNRRMAIIVLKSPKQASRILLKEPYEMADTDYKSLFMPLCDGLHKILKEWTDHDKSDLDNLRKEYGVAFNDADNPISRKLVDICVNETKKYFNKTSITLPTFQSFWVSIWSIIFKERYLLEDGHVSNMQSGFCKGANDCWNTIAYKSLLKHSKVKTFLGANEESPSLYEFIMKNPKIKSLTITYQRDARQHNDLAEQEDAINTMEMSPKGDAHLLYVVDFDPNLSADDCGAKMDEITSGEYCGGNTLKVCLASAYYDFLFLRRLANSENACIEGIIQEYQVRWHHFIRTKSIEPARINAFTSFIDDVCQEGKRWVQGGGTIDRLPRAFITFSPSSLLKRGDFMDSDEQKTPGNVMIVTDKILPPRLLGTISHAIESCFDTIRMIEMRWKEKKHQREARRKSVQTAIAAIMSRNMSHNIGSHVLARISDDDAADFSTLAKYLQQRQDFIAQICTEWPQWTDSACLSHNLMAWFLQQKPLLKYIARSEGLSATTFETKDGLKKGTPNCKADKDFEKERNRIGFVMRLIKPSGGYVNGKDGKRKIIPEKDIKPIINFTATKNHPGVDAKPKDPNYGNGYVTYPDRVPVAFPGGRIGWHAFYVILEGIIRNAAKHSFTNLKDDKHVNLNIIIDVIDDGSIIGDNETEKQEKTKTTGKNGRPAYKVRIYTNVDQDERLLTDNDESRLKKHRDIKIPADKVVYRTISDEYDASERGLKVGDKHPFLKWKSDSLNELLSGALITDTGDIEKKNWGLSELRVAAGYLQMADIIDIGKKQGDDPKKRILYLHGEDPIRDQCKDDHDLFVKCNYEDMNGNPILPDREPCHKCTSELIETICKKDSSTQVYDLTKNHYRYECKKTPPCSQGKCSPRIYYEFKMLKPQIIGIESPDEKDFQVNDNVRSKRESEGWLISEKEFKYKSFDYYVFGQQSDMGKNLFESLTSGQDQNNVYDDIDRYPGRLFVVCDTKPPKTPDTEMLRKRVCVLKTSDYKKLTELYTETADAADKAAFFLLQKWIQHILKEMHGEKTPANQIRVYQYIDESESAQVLREFPYKPNTTPYFSSDKAVTRDTKIDPYFDIPLSGKCVSTEDKDSAFAPAVLFGRHDAVLEYWEGGSLHLYYEREGILTEANTHFYGEALSGDCSYFTGLESAVVSAGSEGEHHEKFGKLLQFVESGLLRVVLIDERIQEQFGKVGDLNSLLSVVQQGVTIGYLDDVVSEPDDPVKEIPQHQQTPPTNNLKEMGYAVVKVDTSNNFKVTATLKHRTFGFEPEEIESQCGKIFPQNLDEDKFEADILVIHQGIIDKWKDSDTVKGIEKPTENLIKALRRRFPYVVVTSGRGKPAEVPKGVKFLPISGFQLGPNKKQYEKHPLVQQILAFSE